MMSSNFTITTHGKWLLAGEHAVLRNHPAIVFPVPTKSLTLSYQKNDVPVRAEFSGEHDEDIHLLFWSVLEHGMELTNRNLSDILGHFHLSNTIPIGVGMGASAALSVALSHWFVWQNWVAESQLQTFAQNLEDLFHSESSGVDIAGALAGHGTLFQRNLPPQSLEMNWQPHWCLSFSDQIGMTSHCVKKVKELWQQHPQQAERIDEEMKQSVQLATEALKADVKQGLTKLATAINQAKICFSQWGLTGGKVEQHISQLLSLGALAAKPTGSGSGGYILSLWQETPPDNLGSDTIILN